MILFTGDAHPLRSRDGAQTPIPVELHSHTPLTFVSDDDALAAPTSTSIMWPGRLNGWHSYITAGSLEHVRAALRDRLDRSERSDRLIIVDIPVVHDLLTQTSFLTRNQMREIARLHHVRVPSSNTKGDITSAFSSHDCSMSCAPHYYLFSTLSRERVCYGVTPIRMDIGAIPYAEVTQQPSNEFVIPMQSTLQTVFSSGRANATLEYNIGDAHEPHPTFPEFCDGVTRLDMIREFQQAMDPVHHIYDACAVCGQKKKPSELSTVDAAELDLTVLRNDAIPSHLWPTTYNFHEYDRAFLCPYGMHDPESLSELSVCNTCLRSLDQGNQPRDALANWQYYGLECLPENVRSAFAESTVHERQIVAACRATTVSYIIEKEKGGDPDVPQRYCKNNVAIIPQDIGSLHRLLPPGPDEVPYTMCVLFVGGESPPTTDTIREMKPLLVSKTRVATMLRFLVENNPYYREAGLQFSQRNLNAICSGPWFLPDSDVGIPSTTDIQFFPRGSDAARAVNSGYDECGAEAWIPADETFTEVTGYTNIVADGGGHISSKAKALQWCLDHRPFVTIRSGNKLFPDRDPRMMTFVFPHLDPWGIGGFNHPSRSSAAALSMDAQVRNLLMLYDSPFERDPNFAYVCWNAIQKLEASRSVQFKTQTSNLERLSKEIREHADIITDMNENWISNPTREPTSRGERRVVAILAKLKLVAKDLRGSNGRRVALRNQIRALLKSYGCPALFMTLNPSDIHHKLMHILSGQSESTFDSSDYFTRKKNVADHPGAAAVFFDVMIKAFNTYILRYGRETPGLFGTCQAYFGTVEAQGRGTLHCHMLIWLKGNLNPQALRDRMAEDSDFKATMFSWLESIIKCELPDMQPVIGDEPSVAWVRPTVDRDMRTTDAPILPEELDESSEVLFRENFKQFVKDMAIACNWHVHRATCWKYLKKGEPQDDAHCRMRVDGQTRSFTELDSETSSILLRRLHPWINNYNDLVIFLMKCNMDIKYIGSGQAAKALVYYVTDYVTKGSLPLHLGLQALVWAIQHNNAKYEGTPELDQQAVDRSLMIKVVNAMMGRQELSHQQVMSYLVGGGDHYTSHKFRTLYWPEFDRYFSSELTEEYDRDDHGDPIMVVDQGPEIEGSEIPGLNIYEDDLDELSIDEPGQSASEQAPEVTVKIKGSRVTPTSLLTDYRLRSRVPVFDSMPLWDFVAVTFMDPVKNSENVLNPRLARGRLFSSEHPSYKTHYNRLRDARVVPVMIGAGFPRRHAEDPEERENWYRMMLILFKPWRHPRDLKSGQHTWKSAWEANSFSPHLVYIMNNINIEQECKDARNAYDKMRRSQTTAPLLASDLGSYQPVDNEDLFRFAISRDERLDYQLLRGQLDEDISPGSSKSMAREFRVRESLDILERTGVFDGEPGSPCIPDGVSDQESYPDDQVSAHKKLMEAYGKVKRPVASPNTSTNQATHVGGVVPPSTYLDFLRMGPGDPPDITPQAGESPEDAHRRASKAVIDAVINDLDMKDNAEQAAALRIVGDHLLSKSPEQLLMYVAGVGGTGKSHVVKAIIDLFSRCDVRSRLLLSAPTGIASVLIGGYTIHALTMLPKSTKRRVKVELLTEIWKSVDYLIIDEVSMISALFLAQISHRLQEARGWSERRGLMFGGVNVIFLGDFGQLSPVGACALYAQDLVGRMKNNQGETISGQTSLYGVYLWRQVKTVIKLQKNMRHAQDHDYAEILSRIRLGQGRVKPGKDGSPSDYDILAARQLNILQDRARRGEYDISRFKDCPIIVADKELRDAINLSVAKTRAKSKGVPLHYYAAVDKRKSVLVDTASRERLLCMKSSHTNDAIGMLPLFEGMKVMFTENIDISHMAVNGTEGTVRHIKYVVDRDGHRVAECVYVHIPGSNIELPGIPSEVVPVFPRSTSLEYSATRDKKFSVTRYQVPLVPAYAYTDYKSQGRSLDTVIVDLAGCRTAQSLYVMLSRVKTLEGLAVLRWFPPSKVGKNLSHDLRNELSRIDRLAESTLRTMRTREEVRAD